MIPISEKQMHWAGLLLFLLAVAAASWRAPAVAPPAFATQVGKTESGSPAALTLVTLPVAGPLAGPSALTQLADGRLVAAWPSGPDDDASAVAIWLATLGRHGWSDPQPVLSRESIAAATFMHINKLGKPVLLAEGSWLHLWVEALPLGDGAGGSIVHAVSTDGGRNWARIERLSTSPLGGLASGLGGMPLPLADGGLGLPMHQRLGTSASAWLRLSATGQSIDKARLPNDHGSWQPSVAPLDGRRALAIARQARGDSARATLQTGDGGQTWEAARSAGLPNPDAPVALLRLASGRLLLAGNPQQGKEALQLWLSHDDGRTWKSVRTVEAGADGAAEFAFPTLLQSRDGRIQLTYTSRRQAIRHATFNEAWLDEGQQ